MKKAIVLFAASLFISASPKGIDKRSEPFQYKNYAMPTVQAYDSLAVSFEGLLDKLDHKP